MVHQAFIPNSVIDQLPHKIESIETYQDRLLLGSSDGTLFIYEVKMTPSTPTSPTSTGKNYSVKFQNAHKAFSKKAINQLSVVERHGILLSLSDTFINVHNLNTFQLRTQLSKSKGCHLFALDNKNEANKKLKMVIAVKKKLIVFLWDGNEFEEIKELNIPDVSRTLTWCGDSICVGMKKEYLLINVQTEKTEQIFSLSGKGFPTAVKLPNNTILLGRDTVTEHISIFYTFTGKPISKHGLPWSETPIALESAPPYVIGVMTNQIEVRTSKISNESTMVQNIPIKARLLVVNGDTIYAASQSQVWRLAPIPIENQIEQLVNGRQFEEALALCESIPENPTLLKNIKSQFSYHLFSLGNFERSLNLFKELQIDAIHVMGLFKSISLLPLSIQQELVYPMVLPEIGGAALDKGLGALAKYLVIVRSEEIQSRAQKEKEMERVFVVSTDQFDQQDYQSVTDFLTIVDTCLLKAYTKIGDPGLANLLRAPNRCHLNESIKWLTLSKRFYEMVLLYRSKGKHQDALSLLSELGQSTSPNVLSGPAETINYLKELGRDQFDLIVQYSKSWIMSSHPAEALAIFTHPRLPEQELSPDLTLKHIQANAPCLCIPYLEHLIFRLHSDSPEMHNELVFSYLNAITNPNVQTLPPNRKGSVESEIQNLRRKLIEFLESPQAKYQAPRMLTRFPRDALYEEKAILLGKIKQHEKALEIYIEKLNDPASAEQYCAKYYNPEDEDYRDVYLNLFRIYLRMPDSTEKALQLLNRFHTNMDLARVLDFLPPETPISRVQNVFEDVLQEYTQIRRNRQVVKNLLRAENLFVREQLIRAESGVVRIDEDRVCASCTKRLGNTAFAFHSNGAVVHYGCQNAPLAHNWHSLN